MASPGDKGIDKKKGGIEAVRLLHSGMDDIVALNPQVTLRKLKRVGSGERRDDGSEIHMATENKDFSN